MLNCVSLTPLSGRGVGGYIFIVAGIVAVKLTFFNFHRDLITSLDQTLEPQLLVSRDGTTLLGEQILVHIRSHHIDRVERCIKFIQKV